MPFTAPEFLFGFLPATVLAVHVARRRGQGAAVGTLLAASGLFYAVGAPGYLGLFAASVLGNFAFARRLRARPSNALLAVAVGANLAVLAASKYLPWAGQAAGILSEASATWVLPLAISFYTFQQIAFLVDCRRGQVAVQPTLAEYALFVGFFPHLVAGPLVHHREMVPQFRALGPAAIPPEMIARGLFLIVVGLAKKVLVADPIARQIDPAFSAIETLSFYDAWTATLGFTLQLYFDFSAYSEIAMGLALLFGLALPLNFNAPYQARNIAEFWRRWHITLGRFLREYLYIPLGGNRRGWAGLALAAMLTFLLGGLWHGAAGHFVLWGGVHGAAVGLYAGWRRLGIGMHAWLAQGLTFAFVTLAWVLFRADSTADAMTLYGLLLGGDGVVLPPAYAAWLADVPGLAFRGGVFNGLEFIPLAVLTWVVLTRATVHTLADRLRPTRGAAAMLVGLGTVVAFNLGATATFRYWSF